MASAALRHELSCSICLNLYTEPMSLRCGHFFCRECMVAALDTQERSGVYSCPECQEEYEERPTLEKNRKLRNIVDNFRSTQQKEEISMCDKHLTAHNKSMDHVLVEPTSSFRGKKCSIHMKLLKYYCSEHGVCLCVSGCLVGTHQGHKFELLEEASKKKKETFKCILEKLRTTREATEQKIESLQDQKRKAKKKEDEEKKKVTDFFEDLRKQLDVPEQKVLSEVSRQAEEVSMSVNGLMRRLEIQKDELSMKIDHMKQLCNMTDPISVLQDPKSDTDKVLQDQEPDTGDMNVEESSVDLDEFMISLVLHKSITGLINDMQLKTNFYEQDPTDLILDENTANDFVALSDDLRTTSHTHRDQRRPELPERFTKYSQVMSVQSFSHGRHYWEVEVGDGGDWDVAVCYPSIKRDGDESGIGGNKKSWSFRIRDKKYELLHNSQIQTLRPESPVQRLGIYLDYEKGRLSFYQLCDPIRHLHTFTATFTEPLHAAFYVIDGAWAKIISPGFSVRL